VPAVQQQSQWLDQAKVENYYNSIFAQAGFCFTNPDGTLQMGWNGSPIPNKAAFRDAVIADVVTNIPLSDASHRAIEGSFGEILGRVMVGVKTSGFVDAEEQFAHRRVITDVKRVCADGPNSPLQKKLGEDGQNRVATRSKNIIDQSHNSVEGIILSTATGARDPIAMQFVANNKSTLSVIETNMKWVDMAIGRQPAVRQLGIDNLKALVAKAQAEVDNLEQRTAALTAGNGAAGELGSATAE
jgi:hypothetical protein